MWSLFGHSIKFYLLSFKKTVVCSNVDAIPEAVTNGIEGLLVTPGDPYALADVILKVYDNPSFHIKMGEASRKRVELQFCYNGICGQDIVDSYHSVSTKSAKVNGTTV
mmetsp:Transcript_18108/g.22311  ORF Transcript_18108/g.22311 Transcript_18108/m.22311 type:complete len:108 (-) Transcript_18108:21-344(-)